MLTELDSCFTSTEASRSCDRQGCQGRGLGTVVSDVVRTACDKNGQPPCVAARARIQYYKRAYAHLQAGKRVRWSVRQSVLVDVIEFVPRRRMSHCFDSTSAHDFLMRRINYERTPKVPQRSCLERMEQLAALLENPQDELCIVHVAGSKGKGSTATIIAQILQAAGLTVGVYTSPHLLRIEERIAINGKPCAPSTFAKLVAAILPAVKQMDEVAMRDGTHADRPSSKS